jgi:hypothetical protein
MAKPNRERERGEDVSQVLYIQYIMERQGDMGDRKTCLHRREMRRLETGRNVYIEERCGDWRQVDISKRESGDWRQVDMST